MSKNWILFSTIILLLCLCVFGKYKYDIALEDYEIAATENFRLSQILENESFVKETLLNEIDILKNNNYLKFEIDTQSAKQINLRMVIYQSKIDGQILVKVNRPFSLERTQKFQLWAYVGSEIKNVGQFNVGLIGLQKLDKTNIVDKFIITIEPMGKSTKPTGGTIINFNRF